MKKLPFLLLISLLVVACGKSSKQVTRQEMLRLDSLRKDSIKKAEKLGDSLSLIAWGDTHFGMSKKEVMNSKAFGGGKKDTLGGIFNMSEEKLNALSRQYGLRLLEKVYVFFVEDELTEVVLESGKSSSARLPLLARDCNILINQFIKKYGKPVSRFKGDITSYDFSDNQDKLMMAQFAVGKKGILVYISQFNYEYDYEVDILNTAFPKKQPSSSKTKEDLEQEKVEKQLQQEVMENSF